MEFLIQSLCDVLLFQLVKITFCMRIILRTFLGSSSERNFAYFSKRYYLFQDPLVVVQVLFVIRTKGFSNCGSHIILRIIWNYCFISYLIIDFNFRFHARCSFLLFVGKTILFSVILCVYFFIT